MSLKQAREAAAAIRELLEAGQDPLRLEEPAGTTFGAALDTYLVHLRSRHVKHEPQVRATLGKHCADWVQRPLADVSRGELHQRLDKVILSGRGAATNTRRFLSALFAFAHDRGLIATNPMLRLRRPDLAAAKDARTPLHDDQIREVWRLKVPAASQLKLLLLTGARKRELGLSRWHEYDFEAKVLRVPPSRHKAGTGVEIPLSTAALDALAEHARASLTGLQGSTDQVLAEVQRRKLSTPVFVRPGYLDSNRVAFIRRHLTFRLKPHDLRSTCATRMSKLGVLPHVVEACQGRVTPGLHAVYSKYDMERERAAAFELYGQHIMEVVSGRAR